MKEFQIGLYGLGVMGSSLAKNFINKGFKTAVFSKEQNEREHFFSEGDYCIYDNEEDFVNSLISPKIVFIMVTAGKPVDMVIESLILIMGNGGVIIDGGNSYFEDTSRRYHYLKSKGIDFLGIGVSGGEKGALEGPSMMVGGSISGFEKSKEILKKIAAKAGKDYCCSYVGKEGAGHYVKMVHNGIEYAVIQLIADTYHIMKNGLKLEHGMIRDTFESFKGTELDSYLIDITVDVLSYMDDDGKPLVDKILDVAKQKGTGSWTIVEAISRGVYIPTISEAVFARYFSAEKALRQQASSIFFANVIPMEIEDYQSQLKSALTAGIICSYAQGLELIKKASKEYNWNVNLENVTALWREGCIIRSVLLTQITAALTEGKENILLSPKFRFMNDLEDSWRNVCIKAMQSGIAIPTLISTISYFDCYRTENMQVNIVQALRDCFGAHTYERIDKEGIFHTNWN